MRLTPIFAVLLAAAALLPKGEAREIKGYSPKGGEDVTVFELPITDTIDLGLASFVDRVLAGAKEGDLVLLKLKTFGGRVDAAVRIRDTLLESKATTIAYIDHRAISAGALIALACDTIIMSPGASIGAATPVELGEGGEAKATSEKVVSYMRAEMRATAEAKGRRGDIAEAMVDATIAVPGVSEAGKLLTLTGERAKELGIANDIAPTYEAVFELLNLARARRVESRTHWGEKVARFLTDPVVSSLLMSLGVLGLLMELYTGGHGIGGAVGLACLALFFFGQHTARLAGMEEMLLFGLGAVLLLIEIFFIPGFGVTGVLGIIAMGAGLAMSLVELNLPFSVSFELGYFQQAVQHATTRLALAVVVLIVGVFVLGRYMPGTRLGKHVILQADNAAAQGYVGTADTGYRDLLGKTGLALGTLRPSGIADFDGQRVDVVSEGDYIEPGSAVQVLKIDGNRVVVRRAEIASVSNQEPEKRG